MCGVRRCPLPLSTCGRVAPECRPNGPARLHHASECISVWPVLAESHIVVDEMSGVKPPTSHHSIEVEATTPSVDPRQLLTGASTEWFRRFAILAVHRHASAASVRAAPWLRLEPGVAVGSRGMTASLAWWPRLGAATFRSFHGELRVRVTRQRIVFGISGTATGGDPAQTNAILTDLLRLIAEAVGSAEPAGG